MVSWVPLNVEPEKNAAASTPASAKHAAAVSASTTAKPSTFPLGDSRTATPTTPRHTPIHMVGAVGMRRSR